MLGLEGSRWYNGGPHQYTEKKMWKTIRSLRPKIWWKKGIDIIEYAYQQAGGTQPWPKPGPGFYINERIDQYCPNYFIHGHIHAEFSDSAERITKINKTKVVNTYGYYLFEIHPDQVSK